MSIHEHCFYPRLSRRPQELHPCLVLKHQDGRIRVPGRHPKGFTHLLAKLKPLGDSAEIKICYEAGLTGYGLHREFPELEFDCQVVALSKAHAIASDPFKTDRHDALKLERFLLKSRRGTSKTIYLQELEQRIQSGAQLTGT